MELKRAKKGSQEGQNEGEDKDEDQILDGRIWQGCDQSVKHCTLQSNLQREKQAIKWRVYKTLNKESAVAADTHEPQSTRALKACHKHHFLLGKVILVFTF